MEQHTAMYPRGLPGLPDDLVTAYVNGRHSPWVYVDSGGMYRVASRPHAGVQHLRGHRIEQLLIGASSVPPRCR
jgi:hypothetical protein